MHELDRTAVGAALGQSSSSRSVMFSIAGARLAMARVNAREMTLLIRPWSGGFRFRIDSMLIDG